PEYFRQFRGVLGDPEVIDAIPVTKTQQIPLRCLNISPSTQGQNAEALDVFFLQTGIGDPIDNPQAVPVRNWAIPIAGDLLTLQHNHSLQESRAEEGTPWCRLQGLVSIMGLFHLKMACADTVWRIFIHPKPARVDSNPTSLMAHISQMRPKETGKIETKPGFRRMHKVIQHIGIASRLDLWRLEAKKTSPQNSTLENFADSETNLEGLCTPLNVNDLMKSAINNMKMLLYNSNIFCFMKRLRMP
ncbi:hypothetical protein B0H34DRAFT_664279, partial [Crassisporium funariophilum]